MGSAPRPRLAARLTPRRRDGTQQFHGLRLALLHRRREHLVHERPLTDPQPEEARSRRSVLHVVDGHGIGTVFRQGRLQPGVAAERGVRPGPGELQPSGAEQVHDRAQLATQPLRLHLEHDFLPRFARKPRLDGRAAVDDAMNGGW